MGASPDADCHEAPSLQSPSSSSFTEVLTQQQREDQEQSASEPEPIPPNRQTVETMLLVKRLSLTLSPEGQLESLKFDVFEPAPDDLQTLCLTMMANLDAFAKFDRRSVTALVGVIRQQYLDQPFHNWRHAVSVMHMAYLFISRHGDVRTALGTDKVLATMISALGHDLNHPGHTSQFEVNSDSELAQRFNGKSVLENYHAACLMKILRNPETDPFRHLEPAVRRSLRESMIDAILKTDMSKHGVFNKRLEAMDDRHAMLSPASFADHNFLIETIVHAADISAQGYDLPIAIEWEARITAEFQQQAAHEMALGIPVASFMTDLDDEKHRAQLQVSFIDFVLRPFWKEVARLLPGAADVYHNIILRSRQYYVTLKNDGGDAAHLYLGSISAGAMGSHAQRAHTFPPEQRLVSGVIGANTPVMAPVSESITLPEPSRGSGSARAMSAMLVKSSTTSTHTRLHQDTIQDIVG